VHVERVHVEVITCEVERLEHLLKGEVLAWRESSEQRQGWKEGRGRCEEELNQVTLRTREQKEHAVKGWACARRAVAERSTKRIMLCPSSPESNRSRCLQSECKPLLHLSPSRKMTTSSGSSPTQANDHDMNPPSSPSLKMTTSSGSFRSLDLMNLSRCFWCMQAEWWMCVST
jgi:hypothetical protein